MRRQRINHFAARDTCSDGFRIVEAWQMRLPILRQLATDGLVPLLAAIGMLRGIILNQIVPFTFVLLASIEGPAEMLKRFIGNKELLVFGPSEMPLGFAHRLLARRIAVCLARAGRRHAITDNGLD